MDLIKNTDSDFIDSGFTTQIVIPGERALIEMQDLYNQSRADEHTYHLETWALFQKWCSVGGNYHILTRLEECRRIGPKWVVVGVRGRKKINIQFVVFL